MTRQSLHKYVAAEEIASVVALSRNDREDAVSQERPTKRYGKDESRVARDVCPTGGKKMLKSLTIAIGLLIIVTRGFAFIFPGNAKALVTRLTPQTSLIRAIGFAILVLALLIFLALGGNTAGLRYVMWILAILFFISGLFLVLLPAQYGALMNWFSKLPDQAVRFLGGIGVLFGIFILILGLAFY